MGTVRTVSREGFKGDSRHGEGGGGMGDEGGGGRVFDEDAT